MAARWLYLGLDEARFTEVALHRCLRAVAEGMCLYHHNIYDGIYGTNTYLLFSATVV